MEVESRFDTPVLFLIFNRPDPSFKVFEEIRKLKPARLYIAADGPRVSKVGEPEKCERAREVLKSIDWNCDVKTLFREKNLGCKMAVSSAITWFFENEEQGIILEDDCVPDQSFFMFCRELLERYKTNTKIMHIGGNNFNPDGSDSFSYYFSNYNHIWGWATWRRAWASYNVGLQDFPAFLAEGRIRRIFGTRLVKYSWLYKFWKVYRNKIDTWDYQWTYAIWNNNGISITPARNLVSNIGFDADGTHTKSFNEKVAEIPAQRIMEIVHPRTIEVDHMRDKMTEKISYNITFLKKIIFCVIIKSIRIKNIES